MSEIDEYEKHRLGYTAALYHLIGELAPLFLEVLLDIREQQEKIYERDSRFH
mgnify:FL=1